MFIYSNSRPFTIIDVLGIEYDLLFWRVTSFSFTSVFTNNPTQFSSSQRLLICKRSSSFFATVDHSRRQINNMETEMLDLSGYTPEERRHLESVMMRQRHEEEKDRVVVEKKREEMKMLEETIQKQRNEMHKKVGSELEATCHICMKTKFADGVGHICHYCNIRCCARCGGKVTLRSNKVIWVCILCRKKQEFLSKSGQWINQRMSSNDSKQEHDREMSMLSDKRAKLERTQSAAEKENQPLERSGSLLRRQYSHQEQSRTNNDVMRGEKNRCSREEEGRLHRKDTEMKQGGIRYHRRGEMSGYKSDSYTSEKSLDRLENPPQRAGSSTVIYQSPSRKYRRSSKGESLMRKEMQTNVKPHQRNLPRQSFSSSDDELKSLSECNSEDRDYAERNSVERRDKMKPSVMITSPGSPDLGSIYRSRNSRISSVGGRIQVKIWFDSSTLKLVVTLVCAVGLVPRPNGQARNPYAKLYLLPDRSEKSKRRTKTLASTNEPKWNQHFIYTSVRRSDLKVKEIEISVWDYARYSTNDFLGEARIDLAIAPLNDEAEWIHLNPHEETFPSRIDCGAYVPSDHLSPPSTTSRLSDSDTSDFDDTNRRVADGASISSLGSSTSPPPDYEKNEKRRSRRDMISPLEYKTPSYKGSLYKHQSLERDIYNKTSYSGYPQRSRSAAPTDTPSLHYRSRSKSPTSAYERSLSPTTHRAQSYGSVYPIPACGPKIYTRSATSTPISSPKRRMLPKIPTSVSSALRERIAHDIENRGMYMKNNHRARQPRQGGGRFSGWNRHHYGGLSDSDLPHQHRSLSPPSARELGFFCGPKKEGDVEDSYSIDSSTFSTQSEQPQKSRFDDYGRRESSQQSPSTSGPPMESLERSLSHSDMPNDKNIGENSYSDLSVHNLPPNDNQRNKCSPSTSERGSVKSIPGARGSPDSYSSLPKKSNSTSQLSATGRKRRLGFGSSMKSSFTVQRSEEIFPDEVRHLVKQTSSISSDGDGSQDGDSAGVLKIAEDEKYQNFIGALGPGQLVGRQVLGTPPLGEVQVSIGLEKGKLTVEVIKVRGVQPNPDLKNIPTRPYIKLYLVRGKKCLEKNKTKAAPPSVLEPTYQTSFTFKTNPDGCVLQITLWGERKAFMGITQIALNNLDLNRVTVGWYKLYKTSAMT